MKYEYYTTWQHVTNPHERFSIIPVPPDTDCGGEWELINGSLSGSTFAWHWRRPLRAVDQTECYAWIGNNERCVLRYRHEGSCSGTKGNKR